MNWVFENALNDDKIWADIVERLLELSNRLIPEIINDIRVFMKDILTEEGEKESDEFDTEDETPDGNQRQHESGRWEDSPGPQESSDPSDEERRHR